MLTNSNVEDLVLNFAVEEEDGTINELIEDGTNVSVTEKNKG